MLLATSSHEGAQDSTGHGCEYCAMKIQTSQRAEFACITTALQSTELWFGPEYQHVQHSSKCCNVNTLVYKSIAKTLTITVGTAARFDHFW